MSEQEHRVSQGWDEKAVFLEALRLPPANRESFLHDACPDDAARARIDLLLRYNADPTLGLPEPTLSGGPPASDPERIDEFVILGRLGEGGMGVVYQAKDTVLGRLVALKILARHLTGSEQALARFREEARSAAALTHPAIVPVFKFGFDGMNHYLVSEYVEGSTLAKLIAEQHEVRSVGAQSRDVQEWHRRVAGIVGTIADALECSHRAGIIHRDVKPSNILLDRERGPRLTDFGIAKHLTDDAQTRHTGVLGTCHYMSPEQAAAASAGVDQRSDIFSLGVVLYELLALRKPFDGENIQEVLRAVQQLEAPRLRSVNSSIPRDLETICEKALEKRPAQRYQMAAYFAADLRCWLAGLPILARSPRWPIRVLRTARRRRRVLFVVVAALLTVGFGGTVWRSRELQREATAEHLETLAWIVVKSPFPCKVFVQAYEPKSWVPTSDLRLVESAPREPLYVLAGRYRLVIRRSADGAYGEMDLVVQKLGKRNVRTIRVGEARASLDQPVTDNETFCGLGPLKMAERGSMVIEGGDFSLHRPASSHSLLRGIVRIETFLFDRQQVSNAQYEQFVRATGYRKPYHWGRLGDMKQIADLPVIWISRADAEAYAAWCGKRLPTVAEWQAAARGARGDLYPNGDDQPIRGVAPILDDNKPATIIAGYLKGVVGVGQPAPWDQPGRPLHTFSNVREWTGSVDPTLRDAVTVGRAWSDHVEGKTLADLVLVHLDEPSPHCGFRCAKSVLTFPEKSP